MDGLNYAMMDPCMREGISGNCGPDCRALLDGYCENEEEMLCSEEELAVLGISRVIFEELDLGDAYLEDLEDLRKEEMP
jgi:hypothetical protein